MTHDKKNTDVISKLDPIVQVKARELLSKLTELGEDILLTSGYRSPREQNALYDQGRIKPGKIITYVRGSNSFHTWGLAIDFVPVGPTGAPQYSNAARFKSVANLAKSLGWEWGGDWTFRDMPHLQFTQGLTISDLLAGRKLRPLNQPKSLAQIINEKENLKKAIARTTDPVRKVALQSKLKSVEAALLRLKS